MSCRSVAAVWATSSRLLEVSSTFFFVVVVGLLKGFVLKTPTDGYACIIYDGANWFPQLQVASGSIQGVAVPPSSPGLSFAGMVAIAAVFSVVGAALIAGIIYFLYKKCGGAAKQTAGKTSKGMWTHWGNNVIFLL